MNHSSKILGPVEQCSLIFRDWQYMCRLELECGKKFPRIKLRVLCLVIRGDLEVRVVGLLTSAFGLINISVVLSNRGTHDTRPSCAFVELCFSNLRF